MKLRNKKTGEIIEKFPDRFFINSGEQISHYNSLAELNAEWEDYEEPKECDYWYIEANGEILQCHKPKYINHLLDRQKEIGNYFETEEEAEQTMKKLKAWKRLKDYNVKFNLDFVKNKIYFNYTINNPLLDVLDGEEQIFNNMKIVFGGEE
jgi:hypothetical protein